MHLPLLRHGDDEQGFNAAKNWRYVYSMVSKSGIEGEFYFRDKLLSVTESRITVLFHDLSITSVTNALDLQKLVFPDFV